MRTTLNLDQRVYELLKELAFTNQVSIGKTTSRLIRQAIVAERLPNQEEQPNDFSLLPAPEKPVIVTKGDIDAVRKRLGNVQLE